MPIQDRTKTTDVIVPAGDVTLEGILTIPEESLGIVVFVHGSGSSRLSPRNLFVAEHLNRSGFATLLFDLLTASEHERDKRTGEFRFDIDLLSRRLIGAMDWLGDHPQTRKLPMGLFGASTGAAAALIAASQRPERVAAVVSRGGRPDLAGGALSRVQTPTLFVVGGLDQTVLEMNRKAAEQMARTPQLSVVPGATHLFEEPGTLDAVVHLAEDWFRRHMG